MTTIARYIRISNKEQRKGLERQIFQLERLVEKLGGSLDDSPLFVDIQSGRDGDRPEFLKFRKAIELRQVDIVVAYRVDRLARDAQVALQLAELFQSTGVRLYDFQSDRFIDFSNPEDWEGYAQRGVSAEAESRKLSSRIRGGYEFSRHKGKAGSKPPWGYIRNPETEKYELNPELEAAVRDSVAIVLSTGNFQESCRLIAEKWGKQWTAGSLRKWISNPCLRGHTGYGHEGRTWKEIRYNTHLKHVVLSEEQYRSLESLIEDRRNYWGANRKHDRQSLGGLVYCGRCGGKLAITAGGTGKNPNPPMYFGCRDRIQRIRPGEPCSMARSLPLQLLEDCTVAQLTKAAAEIAAIAATPTTPTKSPKLLELERLLSGLNQLGANPALEASKAQLRAAIAQERQTESGRSVEGEEARALLISVFSTGEMWGSLPKHEKSEIFRGLIDRIAVDYSETAIGTSRRGNPKMRVDWEIRFHLKPGLPQLSDTVHTSSFPRNS